MRLILKNPPYASGIAGRQGLGEIWDLAGAGECDARDRHCGLIGSVRQVGHSGPESCNQRHPDEHSPKRAQPHTSGERLTSPLHAGCRIGPSTGRQPRGGCKRR